MADFLFQLIHCLTSSEKRQFHRYALRYTGRQEKKYLSLFREIELQEKPNLTELRRNLRGQITPAYMPVARNYLTRLILQSMTVTGAGKTLYRWYRQRLDEAELLMEKRLNAAADKLLHSIQKKAEESEDYPFLFEVFRLRKETLRRMEKKNTSLVLNKLMEEEQRALHEFNILTRAEHVYLKLFSMTQEQLEGGFQRNSWKKDAENWIHSIPAEALNDQASRRIRETVIQAKALYLHLSGDLHAARDEYHTVFTMRNKKGTNQARWASSAVNFLNLCLQTGEFKNFLRHINLIRSLQGLSAADKRHVSLMADHLCLLFYMNRGEYHKGVEMAQAIESVFKKYLHEVDQISYVSYSFNISLCYFLAENYSASLSWIMKIINLEKNNIRKDARRFAEVFRLIVLWELKNYAGLKYVLNSLERIRKNKTKLSELDLYMLKFFRDLLRAGDSAERWKAVHSELVANSKWKNAEIGYGVIMHWVGRHLHNHSKI